MGSEKTRGNYYIHLEHPDLVVLPPMLNKNREPSDLKTQTTAIHVDKWTTQQPPENWQRFHVREPAKGKLLFDILRKRVWLWDGEESHAHCRHLQMNMHLLKHEYRKVVIPPKAGIQRYPRCRVEPGMTS